MIVLLIIGITLLCFGVYPFAKALINCPYGKTEIEGINVSVRTAKESRLYILVDVYWVDVDYIYTVGGVRYFSKKVDILERLKFQDREKAERFSNKIMAIKECFYSIRKPHRSYLIYNFFEGGSNSAFALIISGVMLIAGYLWLKFF